MADDNTATSPPSATSLRTTGLAVRRPSSHSLAAMPVFVCSCVRVFVCEPTYPLSLVVVDQVIGAGFGRTGTNSLQLALNRLGFPCYHMNRVFHHGGGHIGHWTRVAQIQQRRAAAHDKGASASASAADDDDAEWGWDEIFHSYRATVDWPSCEYYKELLHKYPGAKVILSLRDAEGWHRSVVETIYASEAEYRDSWLYRLLVFLNPRMRSFHRMVHSTIWSKFGDVDLRSPEGKAAAIKRFNEHADEVRRSVPAAQLLEFQATDGWAPLCAFLGVPVPDEPYPRVNSAEDFKAMIRAKKFLMIVPPLVVLSLVAGAAAIAYSYWNSSQ